MKEKMAPSNGSRSLALWLARLSVGAVFLINVACAVEFIWRPEAYLVGFEIGGIPGKTAIQGFGILFLMWNVTYPPVIVWPGRQRALFVVLLVQQAIGLAGESWLWLGLPAEHLALRATGLRFILFDGAGLLLMSAAYIYLWWVSRPRAPG